MTIQLYFPRLSPFQQGISIATALACTGYGYIKYWGPYRWLAEVQLQIFGRYATQYTVLFSWALVYLIIAFFIGGLDHIKGSRLDSKAHIPQRDFTSEKKRAQIFGPGEVQLIFAAIAFLGVSLYQYNKASHIGELDTVSLQKIDVPIQALPRSQWWEIEGDYRLLDAMVWVEEGINAYYIPVVSDLWEKGMEASLVLLVKGTQIEKLRKADQPLSGIVDQSGIPGEILAHWDQPLSPVDENTILLRYGDSPEVRYGFAKGFAFMGSILGIIFGVVRVVNRKRMWARSNPVPTAIKLRTQAPTSRI